MCGVGCCDVVVCWCDLSCCCVGVAVCGVALGFVFVCCWALVLMCWFVFVVCWSWYWSWYWYGVECRLVGGCGRGVGVCLVCFVRCVMCADVFVCCV